MVRHKGFLCQAASWRTARRVVAKVEFRAGELCPRMGFIVTQLALPTLGRGASVEPGNRPEGSAELRKEPRLPFNRARAI
jgi:hypothetical protein